MVVFYTCKDSASANPTATCTAGNGDIRKATELDGLEALKAIGGISIACGTFVYDGGKHGAKVGASGGVSTQAEAASALRVQADDAADGAGEGEDADSGTIEVGDVVVRWSVAYYDEEGTELGEEPSEPGQYAAVVTLDSDDPAYCGSWVETITIVKRQVPVPAPTGLAFECEFWETGEGFEQDAFPGIDGDIDGDGEKEFGFAEDATREAGESTVSSTRSARAAGSYEACFRLADPATCEWADGTQGADVWVPWSIALAEFDPNSSEVTYWGTAHDKATAKVTYTGQPQWVRPWFAPAKDADGRFPEWFTHWGDADRPTKDRASAAVVYLKGEDDHEGLVGYHANADGSYEKVTAEQVYAWMFGVELPDGKHAKVKSGQRVWYKTDADGWKVPLAVGGKKPEGAEGCIVARNLAYATRLGVMDAGEYTAYAYFDSGAGFAPTALAEKTVKVAKAKQAVKARKSCKATVAAEGGALAKKATIDLARKAKVSAGTAATFAKASKDGGKKITIAKRAGKVTLKKGLEAGTYKVKVRLAAPADANHKAASPKTIALTVKVK